MNFKYGLTNINVWPEQSESAILKICRRFNIAMRLYLKCHFLAHDVNFHSTEVYTDRLHQFHGI